MREIRRTGWGFGIMIAMIVSLAAANSTIASLIVDFQNDTVGSTPADATYIANPVGETVKVVDSGSSPFTDPFGGTGNKSLVLDDDSTTTAAAVFWTATAVASGTFSVDIYAKDNNSYMYLYLGNDDNGQNLISPAGNVAQQAVFFTFRNGVSTVLNGITLDAANKIAPNTKYTLALTFDSVAGTFNGTLNGTALSSGSGTVTSFNYAHSMANLNTVQFTSGRSTDIVGAYYVDNVNMIPEPATIGMLLFGCTALMGVRRMMIKH